MDRLLLLQVLEHKELSTKVYPKASIRVIAKVLQHTMIPFGKNRTYITLAVQ